MKKHNRMNAKSPDPDDLARQEPPKRTAREAEHDGRNRQEKPNPDVSAPHVPPVDD